MDVQCVRVKEAERERLLTRLLCDRLQNPIDGGVSVSRDVRNYVRPPEASDSQSKRLQSVGIIVGEYIGIEGIWQAKGNHRRTKDNTAGVAHPGVSWTAEQIQVDASGPAILHPGGEHLRVHADVPVLVLRPRTNGIGEETVVRDGDEVVATPFPHLVAERH